MMVETLFIDSCWTTQDGSVMALAVTAKKLPARLSLPRPLPEGSRILAERVGRDWRFVEAADVGP